MGSVQGDHEFTGSAWIKSIGKIYSSNIRQFLPRVTREALLGYFGITELMPADDPLDRVVEAGMAAAGLSSLHGNACEIIDIRRAVIQVVGRRLSTETLAKLLGIDRRTVQRLRGKPANRKLVEAIQAC
jgi:hypothetical protein